MTSIHWHRSSSTGHPGIEFWSSGSHKEDATDDCGIPFWPFNCLLGTLHPLFHLRCSLFDLLALLYLCDDEDDDRSFFSFLHQIHERNQHLISWSGGSFLWTVCLFSNSHPLYAFKFNADVLAHNLGQLVLQFDSQSFWSANCWMKLENN